MRRRLYTLYLFIFGCCILVSCEVINPPEEEPAYIYIESFDLETEPGEGSDSENITELWVYANGKSLGVYDLPASIPVLNQGDVDISISPGIKNNGSSSTRIVYPLYTNYTEVVNLQPLETDTLTPSFSYREGLVFYNEDFEDPGIRLEKHPSSDTTISTVNDSSLVFEGSGTGVVHLDEERSYFLGQTDDNLALPYGRYSFAELNYKANNSFVIGLVVEGVNQATREFAVVVDPHVQEGGTDWQKIYVDLGYITSSSPNAISYEFYIEAGLDGNNSSAHLFLDNIKIIYL